MRPRVLYITHRTPWPPDRGDRIRTWNVLKFLAQRADVDLICLADEPVSPATRSALSEVTQRLAIVPHSGRSRYVFGAISLACGRTVTEGMFESGMLASVVKRWTTDTNYTAAMASSSGIARYVQQPLANSVGRVWIDLIDVDSQKWMDYAAAAKFPMSKVYALEGRRLRTLESKLAAEVDQILVISDAEKKLFEAFSPDAPIQAIGNGVDTDFFTPMQSRVKAQSCVFVGVLSYPPNREGVKWFCRHVWPLVRTQFPEAVFRIVGKSPPSDVEALAEIPGVEVIGPVPDVRPWLSESSCVVVPLQIARGVQNKVLEAMAAGRPIVSAPSPLQGLPVEPGLQLLKAESPQEWLAAVSSIFEDPCRAEELGMAASAWVQLNHRWSSCLEPLMDMINIQHSRPEPGIEVGS